MREFGGSRISSPKEVRDGDDLVVAKQGQKARFLSVPLRLAVSRQEVLTRISQAISADAGGEWTVAVQ